MGVLQPRQMHLSVRTAITAVLVLALAHCVLGQTTYPSTAGTEKRVDTLLAKMTLDEKITLLGGVDDFYIRPIERLGLRTLRMSDGPLGVHDYGMTTAYPAAIALAASWDTALARRVGTMMGKDARARGVHFILAPGMNIYRAPMNGRNFEYLGEDPYLASRMAVSLIQGIQAQGVIATAKHFAANNQEYGRMDHSSEVDERTLREIYLPAFEASVKEAKVGAIMDAYNLVNGAYMTQNGYLNTTVARKEWGFDGIMMSDWGATHNGVASANGGLDLEMPSAAFMNKQTLLPAIQRGEVSVATIDDKVRHILRKAIQFGFYDHEQEDPSIPVYSQEGREVALEEVQSGMVLLKNEKGLLPLDRTKIKTIAVLGPDAYPAVIGGGGSSLTKPFNSVSYLEGISNYLGKSGRVLYSVDSTPLDAIADQTEFVTTPGGSRGLKAEYFNSDELQGEPALVRTDEKVNFHWGEGSYAEKGPVDHFSVRWSGYFVPKTDDDYKFYVSADDGVRLYINDERVIDDWQRHGETLDTYSTHLDPSKTYKIRLEYFENVGTATVRFGVAAATQTVGPEIKALASKADAVVLCMGFDPSTESEGGDRTFRLPGGQDAFIQQIAAVNKNVIVILTAGGNVDMTRWIHEVPALLHAWYPGQEGGTALAHILFGDVNPSGKLPASFERRWEDNAAFGSYYPKDGSKQIFYREGIFVGYRHFDRARVKPLFPFGYGLSYTTFQYSDLKVIPTSADFSAPVTVSFNVKNTGSREGAEVAEVYVGDSHASVPRPVKELKGFAKVQLQPGEIKRVSVDLDRRAFSFYDVKRGDWKAEPGKFSILVGGSSEKIELEGEFALKQ
ncbi:MAG TPA: glycoside hydrolase family 3 C-terminal domain-containing protein [Candidatus Dormibacteraeota bacterium]|nr:glycoside hydrolase family 3 C-terminal domain-containing protein [Candidatus Dormibacteraeota bacterium]